MRILGRTGLLLLVSVLLSGCPSLRPNLFHPGPQEYQRSQAILHDPYPDNDAGPEVEGGRPLDFEKPKPEPVRNQPYPQNVFPGYPAFPQ